MKFLIQLWLPLNCCTCFWSLSGAKSLIAWIRPAFGAQPSRPILSPRTLSSSVRHSRAFLAPMDMPVTQHTSKRLSNANR